MRLTFSLFAILQLTAVSAFTSTSSFATNTARLVGCHTTKTTKPSSLPPLAIATAATSADDSTTELTAGEREKQERKALVRQEGGRFAFDTKYGALNPFAIYYGLTAIVLGIPWYLALTLCQLFYKITGNRIDKHRSLPILITHIWGTTLMRLTGCLPRRIGREILKEYYKSGRPAMFVANHCSWDDIPFVGATIGWRNYKIIAKKELERVPILGKAIRVGGNIEIDRSSRRSQMTTLKKGIQYLKDGVNLCTFAEGTRSRDGRLMKFKDGAFKMAHKAGVPVIPLAIVGAHKAHPAHWMFPYRPTRRTTSVIVGVPVKTEGITETELSARVRESLIAKLPEDQKPL